MGYSISQLCLRILNVNLIPSAKPNDIYAEVAKVVKDLVVKDAEHDDFDPEAMTKKYLACGWLDKVKDNNEESKINRSLVKTPVMTTPYGVSRFGIQDQLMNYVQVKHPEYFNGYSQKSSQFAFYIADKVGKAIK